MSKFWLTYMITYGDFMVIVEPWFKELIDIYVRKISHHSNVKDLLMNPLICFLDFLRFHEKVHHNKELSQEISKACRES